MNNFQISHGYIFKNNYNTKYLLCVFLEERSIATTLLQRDQIDQQCSRSLRCHPLRPGAPATLKFDNSPFLKWWLEDKPFLLGWQIFKGHIINFSLEYMICIYIYFGLLYGIVIQNLISTKTVPWLGSLLSEVWLWLLR